MNKLIRVWIHNLFVKFTPNFILAKLVKCKEVTRWIAFKEDLNWKQKIELFFHVLYCPPCWAYTKHLNVLKSSAKKYFTKNFVQSNEHIERVDIISKKVIEKHSK